jgi:hypothetical protein
LRLSFVEHQKRTGRPKPGLRTAEIHLPDGIAWLLGSAASNRSACERAAQAAREPGGIGRALAVADARRRRAAETASRRPLKWERA